MYRTGRVGGRARLTRQGFLIQKANKNSLSGTSDRSKRGTVPRAVKSSVDATRRGATTLDVLAFSSAIRGAATNSLLFHKTGVMRYDPLKKNVVRPFRALFSLVFGIVRGVVHSALAVAAYPVKLLPGNKLWKNRGVDNKKLKSTSKPRIIKAIAKETSPVKSSGHDVVSHPIRCISKSQSQRPESSFNLRQAPSRCESFRQPLNDSEIKSVLKTYSTMENRDRLISKLKSMRSDATECIQSLSQRNYVTDRSTPLSRRQLLDCKQEMVQLSRRISVSTDRPETNPRYYRRCQSAAFGSRYSKEVESPAYGRRSALENVMSSKLQTLQRKPISLDTIGGGNGGGKGGEAGPSKIVPHLAATAVPATAEPATTATSSSPSSPSLTKSETFKMKLKRHESLVDSLKSRTAVQKILNSKTRHSRSSSDLGPALV